MVYWAQDVSLSTKNNYGLELNISMTSTTSQKINSDADFKSSTIRHSEKQLYEICAAKIRTHKKCPISCMKLECCLLTRRSKIIFTSVFSILISLIIYQVLVVSMTSNLKSYSLHLLTPTIVAAVLLFRIFSSISRELVIVIPSFGVQITQYTIAGFAKSHCFVPLSNIGSIIIIETIRRQRVLCYLAISLKKPNLAGKHIIPLFKNTLPRLNVLHPIYTLIHSMVFGCFDD